MKDEAETQRSSFTQVYLQYLQMNSPGATQHNTHHSTAPHHRHQSIRLTTIVSQHLCNNPHIGPSLLSNQRHIASQPHDHVFHQPHPCCTWFSQLLTIYRAVTQHFLLHTAFYWSLLSHVVACIQWMLYRPLCCAYA